MYSNYISVSDGIQRSINIGFDLYNQKQIDRYVPNSSTCEIFRYYLKTALGYENNYSTALIGPYGKGKSLLILMLADFLSGNPQLNFDIFLDRIKAIDPELFSLFIEYREKNIRLLPVIINNSSESFDQSLLLSLDNALTRDEIDASISNTEFSSCITILNSWETTEQRSRLEKCLSESNLDICRLKNLLLRYDPKGLELFKKIYSCLTFGLKFNPLLSTDTSSVYQNILLDLNQNGYTGLFVVFDEFSKALDNAGGMLNTKLKQIQDFAELANRSSSNQMILFSLVTHKNLMLYSQGTSETTFANFQTVVGRFKEIYLTKSSLENYQMIAMSLVKSAGYESWLEEELFEGRKEIDLIKELNLLSADQIDFLLNNAYPFNPLSIWSLSLISEKFAQNERTLFTALADTDSNSFSSFINNEESGLYNSDRLFDYFYDQLSEATGEEQKIWRRGLALIENCISPEEQKLIKVMTLVKMISPNQNGKLSSKLLSAFLDLDLTTVSELLDDLVNRRLIKIDKYSQNFDFDYVSSAELNLLVSQLKAESLNLVDYSTRLIKALDERYFIARKYNLKYSMTRYFDSIAVFSDDIELLSELIPYTLKNADGLVINVLGSAVDFSQLKLENYQKPIVVRDLPLDVKDLKEIMSSLQSVDKILNNSDLSELILSEAELLYQEIQRNLKQILQTSIKNGKTLVLETGETYPNATVEQVEEIISELCYKNYPDTPVINNEMINKHILSAGYVKPVRRVIDSILERTDESFIEEQRITSPEANTYFTFFNDDFNLHSDIRDLVEIIKDKLNQNMSNSDKCSMDIVLDLLTDKPYSIRKGAIPILLAIAFRELEELPVVYFQNRQIETTSENILKMVETPKNYLYKIPKDSVRKNKFIDDVLVDLNEASYKGSFNKKTERALKVLQKAYNRLPLIVKESSLRNNFLGLSDDFFNLKKLLNRTDINSYDLFFEEYLYLFDFDFDKLKISISKGLATDAYIINYKRMITKSLIDILDGAPNSSLSGAYREWLNRNDIQVKSIILESRERQIANVLETSDFDDDEVVESLSSAITHYQIEDWTVDNANLLITEFSSYINGLLERSTENPILSSQSESDNDLSDLDTPFGQLLKNAIVSAIDEFGSSVSAREINKILCDIQKEYLKGGNL